MNFRNLSMAVCCLAVTLPFQSAGSRNVVYVTESFLSGRIVGRGNLKLPLFEHGPVVPGFVSFSITVNEQGKVEDAQLVSGHPLLNPAAEKYLRTLVFLPYGRERPEKMRGRFTVVFELSKDKPVLGVDLPLIIAADDGSFLVEEKTVTRDGLIRWLQANKADRAERTIHLQVQNANSVAEVLEVVRSAGAQTMCVHVR